MDDGQDEMDDGIAQPASGTKLRLLVVDDDPAFRMTIKRYLDNLQNLELSTFFVADGRLALRFCQARMPNVILLDHQLPDMNGLECLRALQDLPDGQTAMVIMLTGQGDEKIATQAMKLGATDYLRKDDLADEKLLGLVIQRSLSQHRTRLQISEQAMRLGRFNTLLDAIDDGLFIVDADSGVPYELNRLARDALVAAGNTGELPQTVIGVPPFPATQHEWFNYIDGLRGRGAMSRESVMQRDGKTFPVEIRESLQWHQNNHYVVAIARDISQFKKMERQLGELAETDALTGLPNRRSFDRRLLDEWRIVRRDEASPGMALIMIDIDYFKRYNDTLGHPSGDHCLKRVATILRECISRDTDLVCRIGGEEFAVILHGCTETGAMGVAERIQQRIARSALPHPGNPDGRTVTVSIGVAAADIPFARSAVRPDALVKLADDALYQAKAQGRNRTVLGERPKPAD